MLNQKSGRHESFGRRVLGGGAAPCVSLCGACYTSAHLRAHPELIGTLVTVTIVNPNDVRRVRCATPKGKRLPDLEVMGSWAQVAHGLSARRAVLKEIRRGRVRMRSADPLAAYRAYAQTIGKPGS